MAYELYWENFIEETTTAQKYSHFWLLQSTVRLKMLK